MRKFVITLSPFMFVLFAGFSSLTKSDVVNYLNTRDTLVFNNVAYKLVWSSHPTDNYYKQEYIPASENVEKYNSMLFIDFLITPDSAVNLVRQKIAEVKGRQNVDHFANFQVMENETLHEYLLDFVMSNINNGTFDTMEWNAYRYTAYTDKQGHRGILLFAYSKRSYEKAIFQFRRSLGASRIADMKLFAASDVPEVEVK